MRFCLAFWCVFISPPWVCNVSAGTEPPKCSVSLSHTHFLWSKVTIMLDFHFPPKCFQSLCVDYFSLGKVTCRACNLSRCIHIWKSWARFSYSPIWSPAAPVRCVHCSALVLVAELVVRMSAEEGGVGGTVGGQSASQVVPRVHVLCDGRLGVFYTVSLYWCLQKRGVSSLVLFTCDFLHTSSSS